MSLNNFGAGGTIFTKLLQTTCCSAGVITRIQLLEDPPPKICEGQNNVQILARFLTTFDFDRKYLRNGWTYRTSEKNLISHNPFHVGRKNFGELPKVTSQVKHFLSKRDVFRRPCQVTTSDKKLSARYRHTTVM